MSNLIKSRDKTQIGFACLYLQEWEYQLRSVSLRASWSNFFRKLNMKLKLISDLKIKPQSYLCKGNSSVLVLVHFLDDLIYFSI